MNEIEIEHLKRMTDLCAELTESNARQSLIIFAKEQEISELTRMLFALGKQDGQTIRELTTELESYKNRVREMDKETHGEL